MRAYLGKDSHSAADDIIATHATLTHLTCNIEGLGHKMFMDSFFYPSSLFDDFDGRKTNSCVTVRPNRKYMPRVFGPKQMKLKRGDVRDQGRFEHIKLERQTRSLHGD